MAIEALLGVTSRPGPARAPGRMGAFCRGLDVTLEFDPRAWQVGGLYLLASVLERFLAQARAPTGFVQVTVAGQGEGILARFPPRGA